MSIEQEGQVRPFEEVLEEEKDGLVAAAKEYVEEEVREDPVVLVSSDSLLTMAESRGGDPKLSKWEDLSDEQTTAVRGMFKQVALELQEIWQTQADENNEACPKLTLRDVEDGIEVVAVFE